MNPRDRERAHILTLLAAEWDKYPSLRFGQLVENMIGPSFAGCGSEAEHYAHCIYHVDDKDVTKKLMAGIPAPTPGPEPTAPDQALSRRIMEALSLPPEFDIGPDPGSVRMPMQPTRIERGVRT